MIGASLGTRPHALMWQLALLVSAIHHVARKLPQQPDTALAPIPSILFGNVVCIAALLFESTPVGEWLGFVGHFNIVLVGRYQA
jgi:hypothetical protein